MSGNVRIWPAREEAVVEQPDWAFNHAIRAMMQPL